MGRNHLLGALVLSILVAMVLAGCGGGPSPTPDVDHSPLASPVETPPPTTTSPPTATPVPTLSKCPEGCLDPSEDCLIKGVVTGMGDKYYYLPDMESYADAPPVLVKYGGRWFCNEQDAIQNGFQKAPE